MGTKLGEITARALKCVSDCTIAVTILLLVGILVGIWLIGGSIPTLIFYGLNIISPNAILPLAFILCAFTSLCTGTSFGSLATMGLVLYGVGTSLGFPAPVMVGAIVSGSFFGDKMSPMSDTTNLAPAMSGTDLYKHIGSMMYTTLPATILTLLLYFFIGLKHSSGAIDESEISVLMNTLSENFNITPLCFIPMLMLLLFSVLRVPSVLSMCITVVISIIAAMITQGLSLASVAGVTMTGYSSDTGIAAVDTILSRGGIVSVMGSVTIVYFSALMTGALSACGVMRTLEDLLTKAIKSVQSLIITTLVASWAVVILTGNQMLGLVIPGQTMAGLYDTFDVNRKVLSRSLEDAATIGSAIIPWSAAFAYISGIFDIDASYIPYAFLCYTVPVFSIICALTGIGVWHSDGSPMISFKKKLK
ncbi:MAG: Na+/H+ antiporter NhaC [Mogibacterium sp.]|nr:Na+/H+ antiporter NhaC [Mogibacterium sp.]